MKHPITMLMTTLVVSVAMLTVGCSTPGSMATSATSGDTNRTPPVERLTQPSFVTIDGIRLDPRLKPVYTYLKALQTGDVELFTNSCSAHVRKHLLIDLNREFEKARKEFANLHGKADAKDFTYEYREEQPFGLACYEHLGHGGGHYVEKENGEWRIGIPPEDVLRYEEKARKDAEQDE